MLLSCTMFCTCASAFAADIVNLPTESLKGKLYSITEGFIVLDQKGIRKSYIRIEDQNDIYKDRIVYKKFPLLGLNTKSLPCKVIFLDTWIVRVKMPESGVIEIPRYRIKDLKINI